jgi:hypothetical protein
MTTFIIILGVGLIAIGTLFSWWGQTLRRNQELSILKEENAKQNESLKEAFKSQEKRIVELTAGNNELLSTNKSLKQTIDAQTSLISELQDQTERLRNMGDIQLRTTYYTEELNQEVKAIFIRFKLKESVDFNSLCPLKFGFQFSFPSHNSLTFRKLVTDAEARDKNKNRLCAYKVSDISQDDKPYIKHEFQDFHKMTNISNITIQVFVTSDMKGNVRDFHDEILLVYFPKNLYQKIESVQLIVNGWIILNEDFNNVDWINDKSPWLNLINSGTEMFHAINKGPHEHPPSMQWTINLYDKLPEYAKEWSTTNLFGSLVDGLNMLYR